VIQKTEPPPHPYFAFVPSHPLVPLTNPASPVSLQNEEDRSLGKIIPGLSRVAKHFQTDS